MPLMGSTITTILSFAPLTLMPGPAGEFVGSIGTTVILAIVSSIVVSLTITQALTGWFTVRESVGPGLAWWHEGFGWNGLTRAYSASLDWVYARPWLGIAGGLALSAFGFVAAFFLPEQFFPPADRDQFHVEIELPGMASLDQTQETAARIRQAVLKHPETVAVDWMIGESFPSFYYNIIPTRKQTSHYAQGLVRLRSPRGAQRLIRELQSELDASFPSVRTLVRQIEQGPPFDAPLEIRVLGPELSRLRELGDELRGVLAECPDVIHTRAELSAASPKLAVAVDEEQARLAGLDPASIAGQLDAALEGSVGGSVLEMTEELPVRVRVGTAERSSLAQIGSLDLVSQARRVSTGDPPRQVPLSALAELKLVPQLTGVQRLNGRRMNNVQGFLQAGVLPGPVLQEFQERLQERGFALPLGYQMEIGGESEERNEAVGNLMANLGVLAAAMVASLVLSFSSFRIAGMILLVLVMSMGQGLAAVWLFGYPFGFMAIVGTMGLAGVAINDSIVVLASTREDLRARAGDREALREVVLRGTRHVWTTSFTTVAGFAPLILAGGGFWPPLAVAISGGILGSTLVALYFTPSLYLVAIARKQPCGLGFPTILPGETAERSAVTAETPTAARVQAAPPREVEPVSL